jgi:toxin ParE1/3/4
VKLIIQASAEDDMLRQYDWYEQQGLSTLLTVSVSPCSRSINAAIRTPKAGAPRPVGNSALSGLRAWPVKGFDEFRVYYLIREDGVFVVVRVLHGRRDVDAILGQQAIDDHHVD